MLIKNRPPPPRIGLLLVVGSVVGYLAYRWAEYPRDLLDWTIQLVGRRFAEDRLAWSKEFLSSYIIGILVTVHFVGIVSISEQVKHLILPFERPIRYMAGFTFALYLFHYPCLQFFAAVASLLPCPEILKPIFVVVGTLSIVWALGSVTERRKTSVRRLLLRLLRGA